MFTLAVDFEFEIGELVFFKGAQHTNSSRPNQFLVIEQLAQRCSGGIQLLYGLDNCKDRKPEIALTRDEPAYRPESDARVAERMRVQEAQQEADSKRWIEAITKRDQRRKASPETPEQDN